MNVAVDDPEQMEFLANPTLAQVLAATDALAWRQDLLREDDSPM